MNRKTCALAGGLVLMAFATAQAAGIAKAKPGSIADKIVKYAHSQLKHKVGRGECTDLVVAALQAAHAWTGDSSNPTDYHWGKSRGQITTGIHPGDIIQFEGCVFKSTVKLANGGTRSSESDMPHHTAIVRNEDGHHVHIYQQNTNGDLANSVVRENSLDLRTLKAGHYTVWTPIAAKTK